MNARYSVIICNEKKNCFLRKNSSSKLWTEGKAFVDQSFNLKHFIRLIDDLNRCPKTAARHLLVFVKLSFMSVTSQSCCRYKNKNFLRRTISSIMVTIMFFYGKRFLCVVSIFYFLLEKLAQLETLKIGFKKGRGRWKNGIFFYWRDLHVEGAGVF